MNKTIYPFQLAPRCSAMSKRTKSRCQAPAERGKTVCRFHGSRAGAPKGKKNGAYKHGRFTCEMIEIRKEIAEIGRQHRDMMALLSDGGR